MAYPTALGSRRIQFMLRDTDVTLIADRKAAWGLANGAAAVRECLNRAATLRDEPTPRPEVWHYAAVSRQRRARMVRWSQWMKPADMENVRQLKGWLGMSSMSEVVRFAVRAAWLVGMPRPAPKRMPSGRARP